MTHQDVRYDTLNRVIVPRDFGQSHWFLAGRVRTWLWQERAACRGYPTSWWFPGPGNLANTRKAMDICGGCPVREECLETAINGRMLGIWGATSENFRGKLIRERKRWEQNTL